MDINQQEIRIMELERKVNQLNGILSSIMQNSTATKIYFKNQVQFDSQSQVGFFGKDAVKQASAIADASGGATIDSQARTALNSLLATLRTYGIIKT